MKLPLFILFAASLHAAEPLTLKLWPEGAPGQMVPHSKATDDFLKKHTSKNTVTDISEPTIEVFRPEKPNGTSVIVAPGGGYIFLSAVHEGTQVCEWLNTIGVTGILLKYRTPTRDEAAAHEKPVADAAKAIAIVREHAKEWNLDPNRVGLLGFSAGGNLLAHIACDRPAAAAMPNFGVMIYGGGFLDSKDPTKLKEGFTLPADAPPLFIACAHDDGQNPIASTLLYLEYKKHNIPAELHLFTKGGHGFGMRDNKQPINQWPQRCAEWMESMKLLSVLESLNNRIQQTTQKLNTIDKLIKQGIPIGFLCGNDLTELQNMKNRLQEAKLSGKMEDAEMLEKKIKLFAASIEEGLKQAVTFETILNDINRIKKEKLELETERDALLKSQSR